MSSFRPHDALVPLRLCRLEPRDVPASGLVASSSGGQVILTDLETGDARGSVTPFDGFTGAVQVALADVTDDGTADLIAAAGPGGGPRVRVLDGADDFRPIRDFFAFEPSFLGGVTVAAGDVTGDGILDVLTGAGVGGGPRVRAFDVATGTAVADFFAYESTFRGGVNVAAVDLTGDGVDEVVTGAGVGGGPRVRAFDVGTGRAVADFFAYEAAFRGGVAVAAADPDGDGFGRIVTGTGLGGAPLVRVFEGDRPTAAFLAGDAAGRGGVAVAAFAAGQEWRIVAGGGASVRVYDGDTAAELSSRQPFGASAPDEIAVAAAQTLLGPVLNADAPGRTSFVDPTAIVSRADRIAVGTRSYVGPFAVLNAAGGPIQIGNDSNVQDNVELIAGPGGIAIGDKAILAHGATVLGDAKIGAAGGKACFVGFNAVVDGATVEPDAFVNSLTRLAPGVVLRSGRKTLVGKFIQTQAEADDPALGKVTSVTDADWAFMAGVLEVNETFAVEYPKVLAERGVKALRGIGFGTGDSSFSPESVAPTREGEALAGSAALGRFRNRIVGDVRLEDTLAELREATGVRGSIRADEGQPFDIGPIARLGDRATFHALEETEITTGSGVRYGFHVVVHGGPDDGNEPRTRTVIGDDVTIGDWAVAFRSTIGAGSRLGFRSYVDGSQLSPGTVVPDRAVIVNNETVGAVEW